MALVLPILKNIEEKNIYIYIFYQYSIAADSFCVIIFVVKWKKNPSNMPKCPKN